MPIFFKRTYSFKIIREEDIVTSLQDVASKQEDAVTELQIELTKPEEERNPEKIRELQNILRVNDVPAVQFNDFQVEFNIERKDDADPDTCQITITNASENTINNLLVRNNVAEFSVAYGDGEPITLFVGDIIDSDTVKKSNGNIETTLLIGDGYRVVNKTYTNRTFPIKTTFLQAVRTIVEKDMGLPLVMDDGRLIALDTANENNQYKIRTATDSVSKFLFDRAITPLEPINFIFNTINITYENGLTVDSPSKDWVERTCKERMVQFFVQNNIAYIIPLSQTTPVQSVRQFTEESGLVGSPRPIKNDDKTNKPDNYVAPDDGISFTVFLSPDLRIGTPVQVNSKFIDGIYKIKELKHVGSFRGNNWETQVEAVVPEDGITNGQ